MTPSQEIQEHLNGTWDVGHWDKTIDLTSRQTA